jgi:hypothetical protein
MMRLFVLPSLISTSLIILLSLQSPTSVLATPRVAAAPASTEEPAPTRTSDQEEGQEVDMPPTPEFGRSPITPKTPGSQFPETPTTGDFCGDFQMPFKYDCKERPSYFGDTRTGEKELDPTTIFVGGLEMNGPNAWNEEKVRSFFAKFGGIEAVKVVRPGATPSYLFEPASDVVLA